MKRFYKFLMPLVAIVAMALPVSVTAQTTCQITITGEDSFGDGWNGGTLTITQGTTTVGTFTLSSGSTGSQTFTVSSDTAVTFSWSAGSYDSEVSFDIYDGGNGLAYSVEEPSTGVVYTMTTPCPTCFAPISATATVSGTDVDFTWTDTLASAWDLVWGIGDFDPDTVTVNIASVTTNSYTLYDADSGMYHFYVRADCGGDDYSAWLSGEFSIGVLIMNMATSGTQTISYCNATIYDNGGPTGAYASNCNSTLIITPASASSWVSVSGSSYTESTYDYLTIYDGVGTTGEELWSDYGVSTLQNFGPFQSSAITVVFQSDGSVTYDGFQINVSCIPAPACPRPAGLTVGYVSTDTIELYWDDPVNSNWQIVYGLAGFDPDTAVQNVITTTDTSIFITGLDINTQYDFYLMAICDDNTLTASRMASARTLAGLPISQFPYFCGFEQTENGNQASDWVLENGTQANYWVVDSATNNGGVRSMYITSDGFNNTYNISSTSYSFAYASFFFEPGEYAYSFDWKAQGESSLDFIRAAVVPATVEFTAGGYCGFNSTSGVPAGGIAIDGANRLNLQGNWQTQSGTFTLSNAGVYKMVFMWRNDGSVGTMPPAAIDNIQVVQNTCPTPTNLTATNVTPDSIVVAWNAGGEETTWQIAIGNEDPVEVNDSAYVFDNLNANTIYAIRVRGICGADDTSMWATLSVRTDCGLMTVLPYTEDFENVGTTSSTAPNITFIPCWTRLDNGTSYRYPYISSSTSYNHTDGGSTGLYWYASTTTGTYGDYQIIVLPGVDTTEIPMNTTMLTFWAKPSSSGYSPVFYVGVMTDPTADSTFQYYDTIALPSNSTNWAKYTVMLDGFTGTGNHVAIRANRPSSYWYAYVDDITLDVIPDCPAVEDLNTLAGPASAMVSWNVVGNGYTGALVEYKSDSVDTWNSINVTGDHYAAITGLDPETSYSVRVSAVCGDATSNAVNGSFLTTSFGCAVMDLSTSHFDTITGTTPATSYQRPVNNYYRNTFSEQIYDSTELGAPGPIVAFSLDYGYSTPMADKTNCQVYMANTPLSTISTSNYVLPTNMTLVYSGSLNCVNGWNEFQLTAPFTYTGGNLAVAVIDNSNEYDGSAYVWNGHTVTGKSFSWYSDSYTYPNSSMSTNTDAFRPNMAFSFVDCIQQSTCAAPLPVVTEVTSTTTNVAWAPGNGETSWNVYYRQVGENNWSAPVAVTTTSYTFTGLNSGMNYEFKVENVCGTEILSNTVSATTLCATISSLPFNENFNSWGAGSGVMPNCWYRTGSYSTYTYISSSYNRSGATGGSIYMYQSGSNHSTIFLPALDTNVYQANQTQLVFHVMNTSDSYLHPGFEVGVLSDPNDISTFVPVDTVFHTVGPNIWEIFEVPLSGYTGNGAYVGFRTVDNPASGTQYTYTYPYLDDFTLELIPTCPRPDSLTSANATTNSVDLGWHERGSATTWIIEYGPMGFQLGTGTTVVATSNPFTLTGLPSSYQGEFYVKSVCGAGDTGEFSRMPFAFGTTQIPATLPYDYDFENVAEWNNWQTSTNHTTANWYRGTNVADSGSYAMYLANNDTGYFDYSFSAVVNAAAYRDIDFGTIDSSYTLSFRARVGGTTTNSYDGLMVFLVDPSIATVASSNNITSPWGNVNDLYRIATVRLDTTWQTYEASFDTISGIHRVAFFWFNQNTGASYNNIPQAAAVDNIHIKYSSCPRPLNLDAPMVGSTNATLTWTGAAGADYEVVYRVVGGSNMTTVAHTNAITLTGLNSNTTYRAWVRKICGAGDTSLYADGVEFMTTLCEGGTEALNYDPTTTATTSSYSPIGYATYNYSYVQTIIDSAYLATLGGDISAFAFYPTTTTASDYYTNMTVYMANVSESDLSSGFILPDATHEFYKVIDSANFNFTNANEWQIHNLDTAFTWDGHSNVLFAVNREHGTWTSSTSFSAHTATASKMRYAYQDSGPYDYTTISGGYTSTIVGDIRFISCGSAAPCEEPVVLGIDTAETTISINWTGTANNYEVAIVDGNTWIEPAAGTIVADTFYTFTGLTGQTDYTIGVRAICGSRYSAWTTLPVTTLRHPCAVPTGITVTDNTYDGATVSWNIGENETEWEVMVFCASPVFEHVYNVSENPTYTVTGLDDSVTYSVAVRAVCDPTWKSVWSDTVALATANCPQVTGVSASGITSSAATINWTSNEAVRYEIEYGDMGFPEGTGTVVTSQTNSVNLSNLESESTYDVYVRGFCTETVSSNWSARYRFTTATQGIDDVEGSNVTLFPNPASTMVTIRGIEGESTVTVVDLNGREVFKTNADNTLTIDLTGYAKGAYFVRITGERTTAIRKLVVK